MKFPTLEFEIKNTIRSCAIRGFIIKMIIVDMKFKELKDSFFRSVYKCSVKRGACDEGVALAPSDKKAWDFLL